jgi:hypothetical protein
LQEFSKTQRELAKWGIRPKTIESAETKRYRVFQKTYYNDPVGFARDCLEWPKGAAGLAPYQQEVLQALVKHKRATAVGPHGLGKTALMAIVVHWFALTRDGLDWKLPMTASVWRQLAEFLLPEIHKWARRIKWDVVGRSPYAEKTELLDLALNLKTGSAFALASDKPSAIEGAHADHILYLFDEAKAIPTETFVAAEGAFSTPGEVMALAVSTPGDNIGRFWEIHSFRDRFSAWWARAVTLEECVSAGRITRSWADQMARELGEDHPEYVRRVLGRFSMADSAEGVIPRRWVRMAQARHMVLMQDIAERKRMLPPLSVLSVDVGGEDKTGDATVLVERRHNVVMPLDVFYGVDPMRVADLVRSRQTKEKALSIVVDANGIGAGVVARLRQLGVECVPWQAGGGPPKVRKTLADSTKLLGFENRRAWAWWKVREMLDPTNGSAIALPPDKELEDELCAPNWDSTLSDNIKIESKRSIRSRLGRSTDRADAVVMALATSEDAAALTVPISQASHSPQQRFSVPLG